MKVNNDGPDDIINGGRLLVPRRRRKHLKSMNIPCTFAERMLSCVVEPDHQRVQSPGIIREALSLDRMVQSVLQDADPTMEEIWS